MEFSKLSQPASILQAATTLLIFLILFLSSSKTSAKNSNNFAEYIGAEFTNVRFSDVPINSNVEFHFILAFAIDYTTSSSPSPTNGHFNIFWDTDNLSAQQVSSIKAQHSNVKVALSLGGDSVGNTKAFFEPSSVDSWVSNAVSSLTGIIKQYHLDGIDIDYEHFTATSQIFTECIGRLITTLKKNGVIQFASIAPFDSTPVQDRYQALWNSYGNVIDYVNFQFYAYDKSTTVDEFIQYFETQRQKYQGGKIMASLTTDGVGGLTPQNGFFKACKQLQERQQLSGIFIWCADTSKKLGFQYEKTAQALLAAAT